MMVPPMKIALPKNGGSKRPFLGRKLLRLRRLRTAVARKRQADGAQQWSAEPAGFDVRGTICLYGCTANAIYCKFGVKECRR